MKRNPRFFKPAPPSPKESKEQRAIKEYMDKVFKNIPWVPEATNRSKL